MNYICFCLMMIVVAIYQVGNMPIAGFVACLVGIGLLWVPKDVFK